MIRTAPDPFFACLSFVFAPTEDFMLTPLRSALCRLGLGLAVCLGLSTAVAAQTTMATIRGKIADEQNALLPGVAVTARALDTNLTRTVTTGDSGAYFLPNLPAGKYELTAALDGFVTAKREALVLTVGQEATIDLALKVGGVSEVITVSGQGALLETTQHTLGTVINNQQIDALPTVGRDFSALALLSPGVQPGVGGNGDTLAFSGQRGYSNGIFVDGASNEMQYYGNQASSFPQDWIQEFQVMTNSFAAEFGTASGGLLNVITRSGSNRFTGRGYGFFRNNKWDAAPYAGFFQNGKPVYEDEAPPLDQKRWGGFFGGPIMTNKLFFFAGLERLDSDSSRVLGISDYWRNRGLQTVLPATTTDTPYILKGDAQVNDSNRVSLRFDHSKKLLYGLTNGPLDVAERTETFGGPSYNIVGNWTSTLTNTSFNELRVFFGSNKPPITCDKSGTGGPEQLAKARPGTYAGVLYPGANFGCTVFTGLEGEQNLQFIDNYSFIKGAHQFKVGGQAAQVHTIDDIVNFHDGQWTHSTDVVFDINNPVSWPDAFTGNVGGTTADTKLWNYAFFAQDTWRASNSLTLNFGLRYDLDQSVKGGNDLVDNKNSRIMAQLGGGPKVTKTDVDKNNWAPRFGLTWKPSETKPLTVRGSAGLFYDQNHNNFNAIYIINSLLSDGIISLDANTPAQNPFYNAADPAGSALTLRRYLAQNYPFFPDVSIAPQVKAGLNLLDVNLQVPYTAQYSGGFTYDLASNVSLQVDYVHTHGYDQLLFVDTNAVLQGNTIVRPDTRFLGTGTLENLGWIKYNGLQSELKYRFRNAGTLGVAYTLAKTTSNFTASIFGGSPTQNALQNGQFNLSEDEGPDNADRRHNLVINGAYTLPVDIQLAGIWTFRSAAPWTVSTTQQLDADPFRDRPEPRNSRRGDDLNTVDFRLSKSFRIGPRLRVAGFWELFNAFNTDNFAAFAGSLQSSSFGLPISAYDKRRQQLGFRVDF
jgi:outer membrane receptor protein involved in Fe transport